MSCEMFAGGCQHLCVDTKESFFCDCRPGYRLSGNSSCEDVNECQVEGICSQECHNSPGSFSCSCLPGYSQDPTNSSLCRVGEGRPAVMFSRAADIRMSDTAESANNARAVVNMTSQAEALVT